MMYRDCGFQYHHAEGTNAVLTLWLAEGNSRIPTYATHHCGVGGIVVSGNELLVVKERPPHNKIWKFPGGYVDLGEDFGDAIVREV